MIHEPSSGWHDTYPSFVPAPTSAENDALNVCVLGSLPTTDFLKLSPYRSVLELNDPTSEHNNGAVQVRLLQLPDTDRVLLQNLIDRVKVEGVGVDHDEKADIMWDVIDRYRDKSIGGNCDQGAHVFVLACTELPLLLDRMKHRQALAENVDWLLDPGRILAARLMELDLAEALSRAKPA